MDISVCIGSACHLKGSYNIIQSFQQLIERNGLHDEVNLKANFCMKSCDQAGVAVRLDGESHQLTPETAHAFFKEHVLPRVGSKVPS